MAAPAPVTLDGRVGEGGGQIIRIATVLAALTGTHLVIENVRGNRIRRGGGGLKAQHVASITYLAKASRAIVTGNVVKSSRIEFRPSLTVSPPSLPRASSLPTEIPGTTAACIMLIFQAVMPFILFVRGSETTTGEPTPVRLKISGGTNVLFSMSWDYMEQVLLPALRGFGIHVASRLLKRGWRTASGNGMQLGCVEFAVTPMRPGKALSAVTWPTERGGVVKVDMTLVVPQDMQTVMLDAARAGVESVLPGTPVVVHTLEDSEDEARIYLLLVAHTSTGLRFGRDHLYHRKVRGKRAETIITEVVRKAVRALEAVLSSGSLVDEYLQDQLVVFQTLAEGSTKIAQLPDTSLEAGTSHVRTPEDGELDSKAISGAGEARQKSTVNDVDVDELTNDLRRRDMLDDENDPTFGDGSTHTRTARWVTTKMLPAVQWLDNGRISEGVGWTVDAASST